MLTSTQLAFLDSVLSLSPRITVFDCDGTLWAGDSGADFFYWELEQGLIPPDVAAWARARYDEYLAGRVGEEQMCGEMVTIHAGIAEPRLAKAAREFFETVVVPRIFPEMLELTRRLAAAGCELWAVSSTNNWVVEAGVERFGIPRERVLAACVHVDQGTVSGRLVRVPSGEGKAVALREVVRRPVDAVFGNSIHDAAMLALAPHPFCINPSPELVTIASEKTWPIYWPEGTGSQVAAQPAKDNGRNDAN